MRVKLGYVAKHHRVITPPSSRRGSIPIMIMGDEVAIHDEEEEEEEQDATKNLKTWSTVYGSGDFEYFEKVDPEQEPLPLNITKDKEKRDPNNRDTEFYQFYDDIL
jgi:hypothetical protein